MTICVRSAFVRPPLGEGGRRLMNSPTAIFSRRHISTNASQNSGSRRMEVLPSAEYTLRKIRLEEYMSVAFETASAPNGSRAFRFSVMVRRNDARRFKRSRGVLRSSPAEPSVRDNDLLSTGARATARDQSGIPVIGDRCDRLCNDPFFLDLAGPVSLDASESLHGWTSVSSSSCGDFAGGESPPALDFR